MIGIIGAMDVEVNRFKELMLGQSSEVICGTEFICGTLWGHPTVVAVSGVGKVNAAICTQTMIMRYSPRFIINSGVAGGLDKSLNICDIVIADSVVTSPLGDPVGLISGINLVNIPCDKELCNQLYSAASECDIHTITGTIASGDQFINSSEKKLWLTDTFNAAACEMESAAIGHVCYKNSVPFGILRSISDSADDSSHISYTEFVQLAADNLVKVMERFFAKV